jgi:phage FluMu protein Com
MKKKLFSFLLTICLIIPCGVMLTACEKHEHKWQDILSGDMSYHWYKCEGCNEVKDKEEHTLTIDWIIDEDSTCTQIGFKHKECTKCNKVIVTDEIDKKSHELTEWIELTSKILDAQMFSNS